MLELLITSWDESSLKEHIKRRNESMSAYELGSRGWGQCLYLWVSFFSPLPFVVMSKLTVSLADEKNRPKSTSYLLCNYEGLGMRKAGKLCTLPPVSLHTNLALPSLPVKTGP